MVLSKRKSRRNYLQTLSDQRHRLALAGLALGGVLSAAIFRRRRHRDQLQEEPPAMGRTEEPALEAQPGLAAEVPPAAGRPEAEDRPEAAINGPKPGEAGEAAPPSVPEPATGELSAEEAQILAVLAQSGRTDDDRTAIAVAASLERDTGDVTSVLRKLGAEGVVSGELYTATGDKIWAVTERGVRRLGAQD